MPLAIGPWAASMLFVAVLASSNVGDLQLGDTVFPAVEQTEIMSESGQVTGTFSYPATVTALSPDRVEICHSEMSFGISGPRQSQSAHGWVPRKFVVASGDASKYFGNIGKPLARPTKGHKGDILLFKKSRTSLLSAARRTGLDETLGGGLMFVPL